MFSLTKANCKSMEEILCNILESHFNKLSCDEIYTRKEKDQTGDAIHNGYIKLKNCYTSTLDENQKELPDVTRKELAYRMTNVVGDTVMFRFWDNPEFVKRMKIEK